MMSVSIHILSTSPIKVCYILQCDVDGDIEYEFPCYNYTEALEGLWSSEDARYKEGGIYGGVLLKTAASIPYSTINPSIGMMPSNIEYN